MVLRIGVGAAFVLLSYVAVAAISDKSYQRRRAEITQVELDEARSRIAELERQLAGKPKAAGSSATDFYRARKSGPVLFRPGGGRRRFAKQMEELRKQDEALEDEPAAAAESDAPRAAAALSPKAAALQQAATRIPPG
eukprot:5096278-Prymnesium_polylepis.1